LLASAGSQGRASYFDNLVLQFLLDTITIMTDDFEWDRTKAAANYEKHRVRFEHAVLAFDDVFALVEYDDSEDFGEDRFILTGRAARACRWRRGAAARSWAAAPAGRCRPLSGGAVRSR